MKAFVKENTQLTRNSFMDFGWGNGYICITKDNRLYGMSYSDIHKEFRIDVNGGLTFSEYAKDLLPKWSKEIPKGYEDSWVIGFDTCHSWDTLEQWDINSVFNEALSLKQQLEKQL